MWFGIFQDVMQSLMETTRMVRRPYLSARMPQMEEDSSMPRNTTVVSVACWYSAWMDGTGISDLETISAMSIQLFVHTLYM